MSGRAGRPVCSCLSGGWAAIDESGLKGGEQPGVVDAGKDQSSSRGQVNGWGRLVGEAGDDRMIIDQAGWAAGL